MILTFDFILTFFTTLLIYNQDTTSRAMIRSKRACAERCAPVQNGPHVSLIYIGQKGRFPDGKMILFGKKPLLVKARVRDIIF